MPDQAKGIPDRKNYGDLQSLPTDQILTLVRQLHKADRSGRHEDLRIGNENGLYSWALPKELPEQPGKKHLAVEQPVHRFSYGDFQGVIPYGYGKGLVERKEKSPVLVVKNTPGHIIFTKGNRNDPLYHLVNTRGKNWISFMDDGRQPDAITGYKKEHFKSIPIDEASKLIAAGATASPKIDGAGSLAYLGPHGIRVYGIRPNAEGRRPEYTDLIGGLRGARVPRELANTILRSEIYGERNGKVISANELAGMLNSSPMNAARRRAEGVQLMLAALAVNKGGRDQYDPAAVAAAVKKLNNPLIKGVEYAQGDRAMKLLDSVRKGTYPLTREGVVVHQPGKRPLKAKFTDDYDVVLRNVFKADTQADNRAGGFEYSLPGSDRIIGRVGTGFDHATLRDMLANPNSYIGRMARIKSQQQYPSGAFRAPSFISFKED